MNLNKRFARLVDISYSLLGARNGRCFHTSIILKKNKPISIACNKYNQTHPILKQYGYHSISGLHSETRACLKLGMEDCTGLTLVNIRIDAKNNINMSKPCRFCAKLLLDLNFKEVYYTNNRGDFELWDKN